MYYLHCKSVSKPHYAVATFRLSSTLSIQSSPPMNNLGPPRHSYRSSRPQVISFVDRAFQYVRIADASASGHAPRATILPIYMSGEGTAKPKPHFLSQ